MLGIIKQGVFIMEDTPECYALFERKVFLSRTEIARNMVILESLIKFFSHNRQKLEQL